MSLTHNLIHASLVTEMQPFCVTSPGLIYIWPLLIRKDNYFMLKILVLKTLEGKTCAMCAEFIIRQRQNDLSSPPQTK